VKRGTRHLEVLEYIEDGMSARPYLVVEKMLIDKPSFFNECTPTPKHYNRVVTNHIIQLINKNYIEEVKGRYKILSVGE